MMLYFIKKNLAIIESVILQQLARQHQGTAGADAELVSFGTIRDMFEWSLTHCGLVTPYGGRDLGQHWLR